MTMEAAEKISSVIGDVSCPNKSKKTDRGSFLHVRVSIDLSLPLCHGCLISLGNEKQTWVSFKYERLPNLYYWCGRLTNDDKDREIWIDNEGTLQSDQRQFGPSIRAPVFVLLKKNVINVLGFYSTRKQIGSSMDCDGSVQAPVNLSALDASERQKGGERNSPKNLNSPKSASNVRQGDNLHAHTLLELRLEVIRVSQDTIIPPAVLDKGIKHIETQSNGY